MSRVFGLSSWQQTLLALVIGTALGFILGPNASKLQPIGQLFINAIHMMVVPVITTAIINAILNLGSTGTKMGWIVSKTFLVYALSMMMASIFALGISSIFHPGLGMNMEALTGGVNSNPAQGVSFEKLIINLIPPSPVQAFADGNILQILVFSILIGVAILKTNQEAESKPVADFFRSFYKVVFGLVKMVMSFAPIGIAALLAVAIGTIGSKMLFEVAEFVLLVYLSCIVYIAIYYGLMLRLVAKVNPLNFFKAIYTPALLGFTTSSSAATLPASLDCAEKDLKIDRGLAAFLLPLGSSFNLNGLSIYLSVATIFAANMYGITLEWWQYATIVTTILMTAMGAAAVPGTALVVMGVIMSSVGIPLGAIPLIAGVDRLNDMAQTSTNVIGDLFSCYIVAGKQYRQQDEKVN